MAGPKLRRPSWDLHSESAQAMWNKNSHNCSVFPLRLIFSFVSLPTLSFKHEARTEFHETHW
jgi:hypothetical protein